MVNLPNGFFGADDIQHRNIHARRFHFPGAGLVRQRCVDGDAQARIIPLQLFNDRVEPRIADFIAFI